MAKRATVPGTTIPSYLGTEVPPRGWLTMHEGQEVTCTRGRYYLDPGHKREGYHLVAMGGELYEVSQIPTKPSA